MAVKLNGLCYQRTKNKLDHGLICRLYNYLRFFFCKKKRKKLGKKANNREIIAKAIVRDEFKYSQEYSEKQGASLLYWYLLT